MVLQILSSFSLYRDIATMYLAVDSQAIQPGLVIVDRLSLVNLDPKVNNETYFNQQRKILSDFNKGAEETVHSIVKAVSDWHKHHASFVGPHSCILFA